MDFDRVRISRELAEILPPQLVSARPGPGGAGTLHFLSIQVARQLADDIFGGGNWRCEVTHESIDFFHEDQAGGAPLYHIEVSCCVRVTLKDGTHREDVGGAQATGTSRDDVEGSAKAIAKSNAVKRCLRQFGNVLGNCLYYAEYADMLATLM